MRRQVSLALPVMAPFPVAHEPMMLAFKSEAWPSSAGAGGKGLLFAFSWVSVFY